MMFVEACVAACYELLRMKRDFVLRVFLSADACYSQPYGLR
jgi:hypothetical protein